VRLTATPPFITRSHMFDGVLDVSERIALASEISEK
jgi:hypothetical protein